MLAFSKRDPLLFSFMAFLAFLFSQFCFNITQKVVFYLKRHLKLPYSLYSMLNYANFQEKMAFLVNLCGQIWQQISV